MTDDEMLHRGLNYELLVEDALRSVVRTSLGTIEKAGLPGETHFYISFSTTHPGVKISDELRTKHPENMTIVLQHQFGDLKVGNDEFSVTLFFAGKPSPMTIPFQSITNFNDPSVGFGLQFGEADSDENNNDRTATDADTKVDSGPNYRPYDKQDDVALDSPTPTQHKEEYSGRKNDEAAGSSADVVSLDMFRKKPT